MPKITLTSEVVHDKYTDYVRDAFDLNVGDRNIVDIPLNLHIESMQDWNIGLICGASGSGKSVILNQLGGGQYCTL